jgi:hypothetical protein
VRFEGGEENVPELVANVRAIRGPDTECTSDLLDTIPVYGKYPAGQVLAQINAQLAALLRESVIYELQQFSRQASPQSDDRFCAITQPVVIGGTSSPAA